MWSANKDEYFFSITLSWCTKQLRLLNFDVNNLFIISQEKQATSYRTIYENLRRAMYNYVESEIKSRLTLLNKSHKSRNWQSNTNIEKILKIYLMHNKLKKTYNINANY